MHAVKLSTDLVTQARSEAELWTRSIAGQIEHWARLGRALEASGAVNLQRVRGALTAQRSFDSLGAEERIVALDQLAQEIAMPKGDAVLARKLKKSWSKKQLA